MITQNQKKTDTEVHHHHLHRGIIVIKAVVIINRRIQIEKVAVAQVDRVAHRIDRPDIITIRHHHHHVVVRIITWQFEINSISS